jgi:hypothetical protein
LGSIQRSTQPLQGRIIKASVLIWIRFSYEILKIHTRSSAACWHEATASSIFIFPFEKQALPHLLNHTGSGFFDIVIPFA